MAESKRLPRIIPVMDIRGGIVVRAIAGRREEYKPLVSRLTNSTDPRDVAAALCEVVKTEFLYVADLDGIVDGRPNLALIDALACDGLNLWFDAGIRKASEGRSVFEYGANFVVAGLESIPGPTELQELADDIGREYVAFSVDLFDGRTMGNSAWPTEPREVVDLVAATAAQHLIVLDLARVGVGIGTGTGELCAWARAKYRDVTLVAGGGVRGPEDLPALADAGVDAVLVASALHDGKFGLPDAPM